MVTAQLARKICVARFARPYFHPLAWMETIAGQGKAAMAASGKWFLVIACGLLIVSIALERIFYAANCAP